MGARFVVCHERQQSVVCHERQQGQGASSGVVRWRLLGANNRPLAVSATGFADVESCRAAMEQVRAVGMDDIRLVADLSSGGWSWQAVQVTGPQAQSARSYARRRECRYNAAVFLEAVVTAEASVVVSLPDLQHSARRPSPADRRALSLHG